MVPVILVYGEDAACGRPIRSSAQRRDSGANEAVKRAVAWNLIG